LNFDRTTNFEFKGVPVSDVNYSYLLSNKVNFGFQNDELYRNYLGIQVKPSDSKCNYYMEDLIRDENIFLPTTLNDVFSIFPFQRYILEIKQSGIQGIKSFSLLYEYLSNLQKNNNDFFDIFSRVIFETNHNEVYEEFLNTKKKHLNFLITPLSGSSISYNIFFESLTGLLNFRFPRYQLIFGPMPPYNQIPFIEGFIDRNYYYFQSVKKYGISIRTININEIELLNFVLLYNFDFIMTDNVELANSLIQNIINYTEAYPSG